MTALQLLRQYVQANRDFVTLQRRRRALHNQTRCKPSELYAVVHREYDPCFVLSTGRSGTKLLTKILDAHRSVEAFHEPGPELTYHAGYAYRWQQQKHHELKLAIDCARYELIRDTFVSGKSYVETNNRITFFARQLAELYPNSRFVHLIRNPHSFVQSGYSRNWYSDKVSTDEGRIRPRDGQESAWSNLSQVGRIAWLWNETNRFILDFAGQLSEDRVLTVNSESLFEDPNVAKRIFAFLGISPLSERRLLRLIKRPVNRQRRVTRLTDEQLAEVDLVAELKHRLIPQPGADPQRGGGRP